MSMPCMQAERLVRQEDKIDGLTKNLITHTARMDYIVEKVDALDKKMDAIPETIAKSQKELAQMLVTHGKETYVTKLEHGEAMAKINRDISVSGVKQGILWAVAAFGATVLGGIIVTAIVRLVLK